MIVTIVPTAPTRTLQPDPTGALTSENNDAATALTSLLRTSHRACLEWSRLLTSQQARACDPDVCELRKLVGAVELGGEPLSVADALPWRRRARGDDPAGAGFDKLFTSGRSRP